MIEVLPIEGTCTAEALVDLLVAILTVAPTTTLAGGDVQAFRDWGINTNSGPFTPRITIDLPDEEKTGVGDIGPATFNTVAKITLHGFVSAVAAAEPGRRRRRGPRAPGGAAAAASDRGGGDQRPRPDAVDQRDHRREDRLPVVVRATMACTSSSW